ncbi:MAG: 50S ribosomal protein L17 [Candidatus Tagabacteria bacterium RIFCSPLOWO2_01_FULL_42_9]|uniref:Large ribosomal subunit protein bL17 n=1 Tax=Candidatus Tagabacteria bacterium RIFCSPLOWO2_01_FULL_42_9 TaxID=1802296 RepID=A0A1G2LTR3_9BACT|nr:MAG: 50S ribosomal protein L17 [Candidatus Tagabacteria bacterium RIFCSPLOWO2_01_FULL_42_9]
MKHLKRGRKFGRVRKVRRGFIRSLLNNLIKAEKITTTEARAKELRPLIEKIITRAKKDSVSNRRLIAKKLGPNQIKKIFAEIAPRYIERKGGYTRIIKAGRRKKGDASPMAIIEFI